MDRSNIAFEASNVTLDLSDATIDLLGVAIQGFTATNLPSVATFQASADAEGALWPASGARSHLLDTAPSRAVVSA